MKTRDRIIQTSLAMFNEQGERQVTTNHIAAQLEISPGNLYYHFGNKQEIICCIFEQYALQLEQLFKPTSDPSLSFERMMNYLDGTFSLMWEFRFLYMNLVELISRDEELRERYQGVQRRLDTWIMELMQRLRASRYLDGKDEDILQLSETIRLVIVSWIPFQASKSTDFKVNQATLYLGLVKVLHIMLPFSTPTSRPHSERLIVHYQELAQHS